MEGTATYRGAAAGAWATVDTAGGRVVGARAGEFTAEAVLTAEFFGALDAGVLSGEIGSFRDGSGRSLSGWRVGLKNAGLTAGSASFAGETEGTVGSGTVGEGIWEGRFHGSDGAETNPRPSDVTGRFDLHFPRRPISPARSAPAGRDWATPAGPEERRFGTFWIARPRRSLQEAQLGPTGSPPCPNSGRAS